jgi:hypothetical protein
MIMEKKEIEYTAEKNSFSMKCKVKAEVNSKPEVIWALLTDAKGFSRWNSTVNAIDGEIHEGERICIHVPGTSQTFRPKVSNVEANRHMTWSNGISPLFKGARTFELRPGANGSTEFIMEEKFSGIIFAMVKDRLPDFKEIFETYALDLKKEAEKASA